MKICHKHSKVEKNYKYHGKKCDWCERIKETKRDQEKLERGERIWTVVTKDIMYMDILEARKEVEKQYPGFKWDFAGSFMETAGFGTYMNKEERIRHGLL